MPCRCAAIGKNVEPAAGSGRLREQMACETEQLVDEILVMDAQIGRVRALEALIERWQKRLWRYAYDLTGRPDGAWDVTQDSWLAIVRGIGRLKDPARFKAWAYRIVTNKANDWIRRQKRHAAPLLPQTDKSAAAGMDASTDLRDLLRRLSAASKTVLTLHYLEGFSVAETAGVLRIAQGTVKSRLHTARKELKQLWQAADPDRRL